MTSYELTRAKADEETVSKNGSTVISDNPEIFGKMSDGFQFFKNKKHHDYIRLAGMTLAILTLIPIAFIAFRIYLELSSEGNGRWIIDSVKILFIYGSSLTILGLIVFPFIYKDVKEALIDIEEVALFGRDFALFNLPIYRQQLVELQKKLAGNEETGELSGLEIVKDLAPVLKLLLAKDKSLFKLGVSGFKMFKKLKTFFEGK